MNRSFKIFCLILVAGLMSSLPVCSQAAAISWTPVSPSTDFNAPGNWNPLATTGDDLTLDGPIAAQLGVSCNLAPISLVIGAAANGELDINDGGSLALAGLLNLGPVASNSTLNMSGNAQLSVNALQTNLAPTGGGICNFTMSGTSSATVRNTGTFTFLNRSGQTSLVLKDQATFTSNTVYTDFGFETDGSLVSSGTTIVAVGDNATLNLGLPLIGDSGGSDLLRVTGGTVNCTGTGDVKYVGLWTNGYGEVNVSGGTVNAVGGAYNVSFALGGWDWMAPMGARGVLTVSGTGVINSAGAAITANAGSMINVGAAGIGGGTLKCAIIDSLGGGSYGTVNFHGGTLITGNNGYLREAASSGTPGAMNVYSEGATIEVTDGTTRVLSGLLAPAGSGVTTIPVTASGSSYVTAPLVKITTASGSGTDATGVATIGTDPLDPLTYGKVTGITITNPGTNYSDGATLSVQLLGGGGTGAVVGASGIVTLATGDNLAANVSGGLTKKGAGALALNAECTYTGATLIEAGTLVLNGIPFASSSITVKNTGTLAGLTSQLNLVEYPATTVESGGTIAPGSIGQYFLLSQLNLAANSNLKFTFDSSAVADQIDVVNNVTAVGSDPITVNVNYSGPLSYDTTVLQVLGSGSIDRNITFDLLGGKSTIDSDDGIHAQASVYTNYDAGYVQLKAGGLLADLVPAWNAAAGGNWNDNNKWGTAPSTPPPNPYPQTGGDRAMFINSLGSGPIAINLNVSPTLSSMIFSSPSGESYVITPSDSAKFITLDSEIAKNWHITVLSGSHTVNADIKIAAEDGQSAIKVPVVSRLALGGAISNLSTPAGFTFESNGTLTGNQWDGTLAIAHGVLALGGDSSFSGPVTMKGYGRLELGSPTSLGMGTANFTLDGQLAYTGAPATSTTVTIDRSLTFAGASFLDGIEVQNANVNLKFTGPLSTVDAANAFRKTGAGTLTFANAGVNTLAPGDFQVEEGAVVFENGTFNKARVNIIFQNGSGDFFVADTAGKSASLTIQNGAIVNNKGALTVGVGGGTGSLTLTDNSQATVTGMSKIGVEGGSATLTMGGFTSTQFSKLSCGDALWLGVDTGGGPAHAIVNMTGYAELHANAVIASNLHIGWGGGSTATVALSGNSKLSAESHITPGGALTGLADIADGGATADVTLSDSASFTVPNGQIVIGGNVLGAATNGAHGTLTLKDTSTVIAGRAVMIGDSGSNGILNLNGGTFTVPALVTGVAGISAIIDFDGGTLQAATGELAYYDGNQPGVLQTASGLADFIQGTNFLVNVKDGGAKIDTNALEVTISQELKHAGTSPLDGGLTKLGDGSLTLNVLPTYTGDTTVNQGSLIANAGLNTPDSMVYVATGATLTAWSIVADTLVIGGSQIGTVATVPEPGTFVLLALAGLALVGARLRRR